MDDCLPIIEVTDDNFLTVLPALQKAIKNASFLAVDCELTGIGERKKVNEREIELRYQFTADVARSHAVIALGLSCFTCKTVASISLEEGKQMQSHDYLVQTFNVLTLCSGSFTVNCGSHKFLLSHGFDFNKLYAKGLQYYKGCDKQKNEAPNVRHLFSAMVKHKKPIVIHNGLMDLTFLYQSFYADLPRKMDTFAADLVDMFPCGIYDTKYIAEFHQALPATYLEYLYKKMQLKNARWGREGKWHVRTKFPPYPRALANIEWHPYLQILSYNADDDDLEVCNMYALHGWCAKGMACAQSHNVNKIVKTLQPQGAKKRGNSKFSGPNTSSLALIIQHQATKRELASHMETKRQNDSLKTKRVKRDSSSSNETEVPIKKPKLAAMETTEKSNKITGPDTLTEAPMKKPKLVAMETTEKKKESIKTAGPDPLTKIKKNSQNSSGHRAGYDAFMTGYIFACHVSSGSTLTSEVDTFTPENIGLSNFVNKVYLMGKDYPFLIRNGTYANMSTNHTSKISTLRR